MVRYFVSATVMATLNYVVEAEDYDAVWDRIYDSTDAEDAFSEYVSDPDGLIFEKSIGAVVTPA